MKALFAMARELQPSVIFMGKWASTSTLSLCMAVAAYDLLPLINSESVCAKSDVHK